MGKGSTRWIALAVIISFVALGVISLLKNQTFNLSSLQAIAALPPADGADLGAFSHLSGKPLDGSDNAGKATTVPNTPSDLLATPVSDTEVNLTWKRNGIGETAIVIQRTDDEETWNTVYKAAAGSNIWTDTSLYPMTAYHYRIAASNSLGMSAFCKPVAVLTQAVAQTPLQAPKNVTAKPTTLATATISFDDTNTSQHGCDYFIERSDDGGVTYRVVGTCFLGNAGPYVDTHLTPGASYRYRIRCLSGGATASPYCAPVSLKMPDRPAGFPIEPKDLKVVNDSGTTNTIKWADTNNGAATYTVERSPWAYSPQQYNYQIVGQAEAGATSFVDRGCTPETSYTYRVKAMKTGESSDYDQANITTASAGTGGPRTYNIGPGEQYPTIGSFSWRSLGPGDTVKIHGMVPYHELLLLTVRGTAAAPITVEGVPDAQGSLPIIDGTNAVQNSQFDYNYRVYGSIGCITTYRPANASGSYRPGYLVIKDLELRNCYKGDNGGNTFTDFQGQKQEYHTVGGGVYMLTGDNITIEDCNIHGNGEGVFGAGQASYDRYMANIVLRGDYIWGNGNIGSYGEHNSYIECFYPIYEYNHYGPERAGAAGGGLKDRSVGTIIRYNYLEASARILDLVEAQNQADAALLNPDYHYTYVYGNVIAQDDTRCANGIHYGGDSLPPAYFRKGILYLWNNTIISTISQHDRWRSTIVQLSTPGESVDARNNIIAFKSLSGGPPPELDLMPDDGVGYWSNNWMSEGWYPAFSADKFTGLCAGKESNFTGSDPGFVSWAKADYHLAPGSPCIGRSSGVSRALALYPLDSEYKATARLSSSSEPVASAVSSPQPVRRVLVNADAPIAGETGQGLGVGASLNGKQVFPADNPWNQRVDNLPVDPNSAALIASIGAESPLHPDFGANWQGKAFGIPYMVVSGTVKPLPVTFDYAGESDPGPYLVPPNAPIEDASDPGADHHVIVIDRDHWKLYELFAASWTGSGWHAGSGAIYDLKSDAMRPAGWTSADAAGLPIFPGLVRYDEVVQKGVIDHALRFTVQHTQRAYVSPARHFASSNTDPNLPPMGMRVRLKASVDISGFPPQARVILQALKTYGMIVADNGGNWFVSGAPDTRWDDSDLHSLTRLHGSDFEVVKMGPMTTQ